MPIWKQGESCFFQQGHGNLPTDRREVIQKDFERVTCLKVVKERLHWYSRAAEHGRSAVNFWVYRDEL